MQSACDTHSLTYISVQFYNKFNLIFKLLLYIHHLIMYILHLLYFKSEYNFSNRIQFQKYICYIIYNNNNAQPILI